MTRSLKEKYETRQLVQLKERVVVANKQLLNEQTTARLLLEAMDQEDLNKVSGIIQKLENIKNAAGSDIKPLTAAIDQAQAELNKYTAGGPIAKAWNTLKTKVGIDNPIVKITTFTNALEQGFKQLPQILKNNGLDAASLKKFGDPSKMTLANAISQSSVKKTDYTANALKKTVPPTPQQEAAPIGDPPPPDIDSQDIEANADAEKSPQTQAKVKSVVAQIQKALTPGGIFGAFRKMPYVNSTELAQALINTHITTLISVANAVRTGTQTGEIAADMKGNIAGGGGDVGTAGTGKAGESSPSGQTATATPPTSPTSSIGSTPAGQQPTTGPGEKRGGGSAVQKLNQSSVKQMAAFIAKKAGVDPKVAFKVLSALNDSEKLREAFARQVM